MFRRIWWFLTNKCNYCGGEIQDFSWKKAFCARCKKLA